MTRVKICGLKDPDLVRLCAAEGADWIGFNFAEKSPRYVTPAAAQTLLMNVGGSRPVAVMVDPDDALIDQIVAIGFPVLQLHGAETPARIAEIKRRSGREVWKAAGVAVAADLTALAAFEAADRFLVEAKAPEGSDLTGGHGVVADWALLKGWDAPRPWLLAGGLNPGDHCDRCDGGRRLLWRGAAAGAKGQRAGAGVPPRRQRGLKSWT